MRYTYNNINLKKEPMEFNKNTKKELLQYAISGLLYMPATMIKISDNIINKTNPEFKSICIDLEDSIGDETLAEAENYLFITLNKIYEAVLNQEININELPLIFIRVRDTKQFKNFFEEKLFNKELLSIITGFNFPKFDTTNAKDYLTTFRKFVEISETPLYIMPILESKIIMIKETRLNELIKLQKTLSAYSNYILNIRVGSTDFSHLYGLRRKMTQTIYDVKVVSDCFTDILNIFGNNYIVAGPVWEYFDSTGEPGKWSLGLQRELELDKLNGFIGKTCIHPAQLKYITESNLIDYEDYQDALNILGMSDGLIGVAKGYGNNKMNEVKTHSNWAKKIVGLSEIYGVRNEIK